MNVQELRNLSKDIAGRRIRHESRSVEGEKRQAMENAKKEVAARMASYDRERRMPLKKASFLNHLGRMKFIACAAAVASVSIWFALASFEVKRKPVNIDGKGDRSKLAEFTESVISDCMKGASGKLKSKWNCCVSRQIVDRGSRRLDDFTRSGKPELEQMTYDPNTSCFHVRYANGNDGALVIKVARDGKAGFGLVGIQ